MKLIIFPGAGDPHSAEYSKVYELLREKGGSFGYSEVDTSVRWPGQFLSNPETTAALNLKSAVAAARSALNKCETSGEPYDILARSFGTSVALAATMEENHPNLRRIILWGAVPHWKVWELFVQNFESVKRISQEKGVRIDREFYGSCEPTEALLLKNPHQIVVAVGSRDKYSSREFHYYLLTLLMGKTNVTFRPPVEGAPHEVTGDLPDQVVQDFCKAVLS